MKTKVIFWLFVGIFLPFTVAVGQELPLLCATTADKTGASLPTTEARFSGGITNNNEGHLYRARARTILDDTVDVSSTIKPEPAHVGQQADILVTAGFAPVGVDHPVAYYMLGPDFSVTEWDQSPANAVAFKNITLEPEQTISLYSGQFILSSNLWVNVHYRLADGTVVSSADPIEITILPTELSEVGKTTPEQEGWTIMVYMIGSTLEQAYSGKRLFFATNDVFEMLAGTEQDEDKAFNTIVATGGSGAPDWQTVKYYQLSGGRGYEKPLRNLSEAESNMADPQTLSNFVNWSKNNFPAQHYALILWNHGSGTDGMGPDTALRSFRAPRMLGLTGLNTAFKSIYATDNEKLDIVVYDACLMSTIEVAEVTATVADAMAASVEIEPGHGLDYTGLLKQLSESKPKNGVDFGRLVKDSYIQHAKTEGTFDDWQITYSVFDLSQIEKFTKVFEDFAIEFKQVLEDEAFLTDENLSRGIIRAPGYPMKEGGKWKQRNIKRLDRANLTARVDLFNILQTVLPDFPLLKGHADQLLALLDNNIIVDYGGNLDAKFGTKAGRVSLNIGGSAQTYLATLPEAFKTLHEGLQFYTERRRALGDYTPEGEITGIDGQLIAFSTWLQFKAGEVLGVDGYFGQQINDDKGTVHLIKPLYRYQELAEKERFTVGVDGLEACRYELCVDESDCEAVTLTEQADQLTTEVLLNDSPAVLSFCQNAEGSWLACGVLQQSLLCEDEVSDLSACETENAKTFWGRGEMFYDGDEIVPNTLRVQRTGGKDWEKEEQMGNPLTVNACYPVHLKKTCELPKAIILSAYHGDSGTQAFKLLCNGTDCRCEGKENLPGCTTTGFSAGVQVCNHSDIHECENNLYPDVN